MPKAKFSTSDPSSAAILMASAKILTTDVYHDFPFIYKELMASLKGSIPESAYIDLLNKAKAAQKFIKYPLQYKTRLYVTAGHSDRVMLFLVDMDVPVLENMIDLFDCWAPSDEGLIECAADLFPRIFIFIGKNLTAHSLLSPNHLAELMAVFAKENKVSFSGARNDLYTKPRLEARRSKDT